LSGEIQIINSHIDFWLLILGSGVISRL